MMKGWFYKLMGGVMLLLAIVGVASLPAVQEFLGFGGRRCVLTYKSICRPNLKQLDGAINTWALENYKTTNDIPAISDIIGTNKYIKAMPRCADGASYIFGRVGERPRCSIADHNENVWPEDREQK